MLYKSADQERITQERLNLVAGDDVGYVRLELLTRSDSYSDSDPLGRESTVSSTYLTIPGRIVWSSKERRLMQTDGAYMYVRSEVTIDCIPSSYYASLEQARTFLVPRPLDGGIGVSDNVCRILDISRDAKSNTIAIFAIRTRTI